MRKYFILGTFESLQKVLQEEPQSNNSRGHTSGKILHYITREFNGKQMVLITLDDLRLMYNIHPDDLFCDMLLDFWSAHEKAVGRFPIVEVEQE